MRERGDRRCKFGSFEFYKWAQTTWWMWCFWGPCVSAQPPLHSIWQAGGVVWCGIEQDWAWSMSIDSIIIHELNAVGAGTRVLWGCATSWPEEGAEESLWRADVFWHQGLSGSNSNQSALVWAEAPSPNPELAVAMLSEFHLTGWLDDTGGMAAGVNGSDDPLVCHAPGLSSWEVFSTCHTWSEPFTFRGDWTWDNSGNWRAMAFDTEKRRDTWVDTLSSSFSGLTNPPCIGIDLNHTTSQGNQWAFGWKPLTWQTNSTTNNQLPEFELLENQLIQSVGWPDDTIPANLQISQICDGIGAMTSWVEGQPTLCENVWEWPLPCFLQMGASVEVGNGDWSQTLWSDGTALLVPDQLCFTEVMADPTPSIYAPESTYLEVLNDSPWAINPEKLILMDSDEPHSISWLTRPPGTLILPGQRVILVDHPSTWTSSPWFNFPVARVSGWSGLRDEGESLSLQSDAGLTLERLTFWDSWWGDVTQDGHSLSCLHPHACDHPNTWQADPDGASPGFPANFESMNSVPQIPHFSFSRNTNDFVELDICPPPDTDQNPWLQWATLDSSGGEWMSWIWDDHGYPLWQFHLPLNGTHQVSLLLADLIPCHPEQTIAALDTSWTSHRPPVWGDVQLTEILPVSHPIVNAEFVEWANVSQDTLSWGQSVWPPGTALVQSSQPKENFNSWIPDSLHGIWEIYPGLAYSNAEGVATLRDQWDNLIAKSEYSECGHDQREPTTSGKSLEHQPKPLNFDQDGLCGGHQFWRSNPNEFGMSPGVVAEWEWQDAKDLIEPSWGVLNGHWVMTVPQGYNYSLWASDKWSPETFWQPMWHRGVLLAQSAYGPDITAHGPQHLTNPNLSFPLSSPHDDNVSKTIPSWNEVLLQPREGYGPFLEWTTSEHADWTTNYTWASEPWPQPGQFQHVSDVSWWLPVQSTVCLAHCPTWVDLNEEGCLATNVPSLYGRRTLELRSPESSSRLDLEMLQQSAWVTLQSGVSIARIPRTSIWTSTPPPNLATPGYTNGLEISSQSQEKNALQCAPSTLQPGGLWAWDKVEFVWEPQEANEEDVFQLLYGVLDPETSQFLQKHEATWAGGNPFHWTWDATQLDGQLAKPGGYIGILRWQNQIRRSSGTEKCLVGVAPP